MCFICNGRNEKGIVTTNLPMMRHRKGSVIRLEVLELARNLEWGVKGGPEDLFRVSGVT